ncbi:MAG TPA: hypothetical protein V6D09_07000 [Leptolyngbyaceae cyanobacterium]
MCALSRVGFCPPLTRKKHTLAHVAGAIFYKYQNLDPKWRSLEYPIFQKLQPIPLG